MIRLLPLLLVATACTPTPWDFPTPTMVGNEEGIAMTGFMKTDSEAEVRRRLTERMKCPGGVDFPSLVTQRADNKVGTHILYYRAVMKCSAMPAFAPSTPAG